MPQDPRIDDYIAKAQPFAQPILMHLRALVHKTLPGIDEAIKWGMPHFGRIRRAKTPRPAPQLPQSSQTRSRA